MEKIAVFDNKNMVSLMHSSLIAKFVGSNLTAGCRSYPAVQMRTQFIWCWGRKKAA